MLLGVAQGDATGLGLRLEILAPGRQFGELHRLSLAQVLESQIVPFEGMAALAQILQLPSDRASA